MRRLPHVVMPAVVASLALAVPADASRLVTWETPSTWVDPSHAARGFYNEPPGVPDRPNALKANVLLPDGYDAEQRRRWPVLFLLHGQGDGYDMWAHPARGDVTRIARDLPAIVVMPEGDRGFYTNWWNGGARGDPQWERYHLDELIPLVEKRLRIRPGRRWHAIAGLSMGGLGTMYYASQRPGYFGAAASFSGAVSIQRPTFQQGFQATGQSADPIWGDPGAQAFYWAGHNPVRLVPNLRHTRLYVASGNGIGESLDDLDNYFGAVSELELSQHARDLVDAAAADGADVTYRPHGGVHDWPYWRRDLANAIRWGFFETVEERPQSWSFRTVTQFGRAWDVRFGFASPPGEVVTFRRRGRILSATGSGTVRVRIVGLGRRGAFTASLPFERILPSPRRSR
jgi:S-formylglutathione hydrolase FrmB